MVNLCIVMGVNIFGVGIKIIVIFGVLKLYFVDYIIIFDRIEVGIFLIVGVIINLEISILLVVLKYLSVVIFKF